MSLEHQRNTVARAERVVIQKETRDLNSLVKKHEILSSVNDPNAKALEEIMNREIRRIKPKGVVYDHEEVHASGLGYTNGRTDGTRVRLSQIKGEDWAKKGE